MCEVFVYTGMEIHYTACYCLLQSTEVPNSTWCEHEGLQRTVRFLTENELNIGTLITDRHKQINAWIRDNLTPNHGTKHYYDVWHVATGKYYAK